MVVKGNEDGKTKRRQNVACDPCKFRRIKCDLLTILTPPGSSTADPPPLHVLVQQHPDVSCSLCIKKGLKCTTEGIVNPIKANKGGRRIDEARRMFGSEAPAQQSTSTALDQTPSGLGPLPQPGGNGWAQALLPGQPLPSSGFDDGFGQSWDGGLDMDSLISHAMSSAHGMSTPLTNFTSMIDPPPVEMKPDTGLFEIVPNGVGPVPSFAIDGVSSPGQDDTADPDVPGLPPIDNEEDALRIWRELSEHRRLSLAAPPPAARPSHPPIALDSHLSGSFTLPPHDPAIAVLDWTSSAGNSQSRPGTASPAPSRSVRFSSSSAGGSLAGSATASGWSSPIHPEARVVLGKRRAGSVLSIGSYPGEKDPWRLYSTPNGDDDHTVRWTRRQEVHEKLADRALGSQLSRHLVQVFFQAVHTSFPAISPEIFYVEWQRAGQRSDRMTQRQEVLCAVIEAWGARYSDSPIVLGLDASKAHNAPKVITDDGRFVPGTPARMHWGKARRAVCHALTDRAKRLIDEAGLYRKPSVTGVQTMLLFHQLQFMGDTSNDPLETLMEANLLASTMVEQVKMLSLTWSAEGDIPEDNNELPTNTYQQRMRQRRIFFTLLISDAFGAVTAGQQPKIDDEEIEVSGRWLATVMDQLPPSSLKILTCYMMAYHRLAVLARKIAVKLSAPSRKKGSIDVPDMCEVVRSTWLELSAIQSDLGRLCVEVLPRCDRSVLGFSPLNYIVNIRLAVTLLLLILHQLIRDQLEFCKTLTAAFISMFDPAGGTGSTGSTGSGWPGERDVAMLELLRTQSMDILLHNCRGQVPIMEAIIPSGVVQTASILLSVMMAATLFLAEVPSNEQGYPDDTLGGMGWTWETKQREIEVCVKSLHQIGWAWSQACDTVDAVMLSMERMQPTPEELSAYASLSTPVNPRPQAELDAARVDKAAIDQALRFWPVPDIVSLSEKALHGGSIPGLSYALDAHQYNSADSTPSTTFGFDSGNGATAAPTLAGATYPLDPTWRQPTEFSPVQPSAGGHAKRPRLSADHSGNAASHPATDASIVPPLWDFGINPDLDWTALFGVSGTIDGQNAHVPTPEPFPAQTNESFPSDIDEMLKRLSQ